MSLPVAFEHVFTIATYNNHSRLQMIRGLIQCFLNKNNKLYHYCPVKTPIDSIAYKAIPWL